MNSQKIVQDNPNQLPLGAQFKDFELNSAVNYYTLDPFQYAITKFDYKLPDGSYTTTKPNDTGLIYKGLEINKLLPSFTATKKSVNDFPAQSYHRFLANDGYFNPQESLNNDDLWYYGANPNGAGVNVQEVNHIIFPEAQRGGLNSTNLAKYSWTSDFSNQVLLGNHKMFAQLIMIKIVNFLITINLNQLILIKCIHLIQIIVEV